MSERPFRVFLLSPADSSGKRARLLRGHEERRGRGGSGNAPGVSLAETLDLGRRLRAGGGAPIGDVFSFVSSLYFRGKLAYARRFARPPRAQHGALVITPCDGLVPHDTPLRLHDLDRYAAVSVDPDEPRYREPLLRDLATMAPAWAEADVVLLGSIASAKYTDLLTPALGERLLFPRDFVGRGDMSRGGLMLRCVEEGRELAYVPLAGAERHGARPARLAPKAAQRAAG